MILRTIRASNIVATHNVRTGDDPELADLERSIRTVGLLQPIVVRREGNNYVCIAGHRRVAALRRTGKSVEVPCIVLDAGEHDARVLQLTENIHRRQMSAREIVAAIDALRAPFPKMTKAEAAALIGKPESWVILQYREAGAYQSALDSGADPEDLAALPAAHIIRLHLAPPKHRKAIAKKARKEKLSAREVYVAAKAAKHEDALAFASDYIGYTWKGRFGIFIYDDTTMVVKTMPGGLVAVKQELEKMGGQVVAVRPVNYKAHKGPWGDGGRGRNMKRAKA